MESFSDYLNQAGGRRKKTVKKIGGNFNVQPDKPLSEDAYIDYASNKLIAADKCQQEMNLSVKGQTGSSRVTKNSYTKVSKKSKKIKKVKKVKKVKK